MGVEQGRAPGVEREGDRAIAVDAEDTVRRLAETTSAQVLDRHAARVVHAPLVERARSVAGLAERVVPEIAVRQTAGAVRPAH